MLDETKEAVRRHLAGPSAPLDPVKGSEILASIAEQERQNFQALDEAFAALEERGKSTGYVAAREESNEAWRAEGAAFAAVTACPVESIEDAQRKAEYLLSECDVVDRLMEDEELIGSLLRSLAGGRA